MRARERQVGMDVTTRAVLRAIFSMQPTTRRALVEKTNLGSHRIGAAIAQLVAQGLVREDSHAGGLPGRPVGSLSLDPGAGTVVGLDIGGQESSAVLCDFGGEVLRALIRKTDASPDRKVILEGISRLVEDVCAEGGVPLREVSALGVGVRGIVDAQSGVVLGWPNTPAWAAAWPVHLPVELGDRLAKDLIVTEDSVRTMAVNAYRRGPARDCGSVLYLFLGSGVGSALLIDGKPYHGGTGLAGELGHVTIDENGPWCSCGNRGCLEVLTSTEAVLQQARSRLAESYVLSVLREPYQKGQVTLAALISAARSGDKIAFQILDATGTHVGKVVAIALNLLGPELVVLGGPLIQDDGIVLEAVRRQVRLRALQHIAIRTRIVADDQGELAGARGAAALAIDAIFTSNPHLERLWSRSVPLASRRSP